MKNLRINKEIIPLLLATTVLTTLSGCNKKQETKQENLIGHVDIEKPKNISELDFIYYHGGDHKKIGITELSKKIQQCKKNNISIGIIIDSDASERSDIFEDIEFTKSNIEQYEIDLPVYFNIENIIKNDELSMTEKTSLIIEYLTLVEKNNICVGLYGTSTSLSILNQYGIPISNRYDCFVVEDGITKYNGKSSIIQDVEGNIKSTFQSKEYNNDLAQFIKANNLNNKNRMKQTGYCILDKEIEKIAIEYDLSVNEILSFNNITREELKDNMILRIPNQIQNETKQEYPTLTRTQEAVYKGIDISFYQGNVNEINFEELSKKIDFVILRIGEQQDKNFKELREDQCFNDYYLKCQENNISVGGYYVTHATTKEEAIQEAKLMVDRIKYLNITFPIYIDYENTKNTIYSKEFSEIKQNNTLEQILEETNKIFKDAGLRFGIYTNLSTYKDMVNIVGLKNLNQYEIWLSKPNDYKYVEEIIDYGPTCKTSNEQYSFGCDMNQVSWTISNLGIGNIDGHVDYNLCYKDYKAPKQTIELPPKQIFDTKKYKRFDKKRVVTTTKKIFETTATLLLATYIVRHKKRIRKKIVKIINQKRQLTHNNNQKKHVKQLQKVL